MVFWSFTAIAGLAFAAALVAIVLPGVATLRLALGGLILFLLALALQIVAAMAMGSEVTVKALLSPATIAGLVTVEEIARLTAILVFVGSADTPETFRERLALGAWFGLLEALSKLGGLFAAGLDTFCTQVADVVSGPCSTAISATVADIAVVVAFHAALTAVAYRWIDTPIKALTSLAGAVVVHFAFNMMAISRAGHLDDLELRLWELGAVLGLVGVVTAVLWTRESALRQRRWQGR
jgi:hypothetical protein